MNQVGSVSTQYDPRRAEVLEALACLYLRLNGYFCISNYLYHLVEGFGLDTESDLLAIRLPHQEEVLQNGRRQPNDDTLVLPGDQPLVDCVIAEVKEPSVEFNARLRGSDGPRLIAAALRMFGVLRGDTFEGDGMALSVAKLLYEQISEPHWARIPSAEIAQTDQNRYGALVRMVVFAPKTAKHAADRKHFDLHHVLAFTRSRMRLGEPCAPYRDPALPSTSPWRGCARLIVQTVDESHSLGEVDLPLDVFVARVIARWPA